MESGCLAFLSYSHFDDQHDKGRITEIKNLLSGEIRSITGVEFKIFQDRDSINWGDSWEKRISNSLNEVTFLIPVISPSFFTSDSCRSEIEMFFDRELRLGNKDLIFPIYYVDCGNILEDPVAQMVFKRNYVDFRDIRFFANVTKSVRVKKLINEMAKTITERLSAAPQGYRETAVSHPNILINVNDELCVKDPAMTESNQPDRDLISLAQSIISPEYQVICVTEWYIGATDECLAMVAKKNDHRYFIISARLSSAPDWAILYEKDIWNSGYEILTHVPFSDSIQLLIMKSFAGSGNIMDYAVFGWIENRLNIILQNGGIFQGSLIARGIRFIEKCGSQAIIHEWDGQYVYTLPLEYEPHRAYPVDTIVMEYSIDRDENVTVRKAYEMENVIIEPEIGITISVGQCFQINRIGIGVSERIMYSGIEHIDIIDGLWTAIKPGEAEITIIPS